MYSLCQKHGQKLNGNLAINRMLLNNFLYIPCPKLYTCNLYLFIYLFTVTMKLKQLIFIVLLEASIMEAAGVFRKRFCVFKARQHICFNNRQATAFSVIVDLMN